MDSRLIAVLATIAVPAGLIGLTVYRFSANPVALVLLITVMVIGAIYVLSYHESF